MLGLNAVTFAITVCLLLFGFLLRCRCCWFGVFASAFIPKFTATLEKEPTNLVLPSAWRPIAILPLSFTLGGIATTSTFTLWRFTSALAFTTPFSWCCAAFVPVWTIIFIALTVIAERIANAFAFAFTFAFRRGGWGFSPAKSCFNRLSVLVLSLLLDPAFYRRHEKLICVVRVTKLMSLIVGDLGFHLVAVLQLFQEQDLFGFRVWGGLHASKDGFPRLQEGLQLIVVEFYCH